MRRVVPISFPVECPHCLNQNWGTTITLGNHPVMTLTCQVCRHGIGFNVPPNSVEGIVQYQIDVTDNKKVGAN